MTVQQLRQLYEDAINYIANEKELCVAEENGLCPEDIYDDCPKSCADCWKWFIEDGSWWEKETDPEPDPDRKWKEMREG